jgi:hypothetical protein
MNKLFFLLCSLVSLSLLTASAAPFAPGNVVVLQCAGVASGGNTGSLVEYAPGGGAPVQTIPLSGMVFGSTLNLAHDITLSADGALIIVPGYAYATNVSVEGTTAASDNRVIATVKWDGTVSYPIVNSALVSANAIRGVTSDGFGNFWVTFTSGMRYVTPSAPSISTTVLGTGSRACGIYNGQLYGSVSAAVSSVSPNMPTTSGASYTAVLSTVPNANVYSFAFPAGAPTTGSTAYVGDYSGTTSLYVYSYNSGWSLGWTLTLSANPAHIAVDYNHNSPVIYFTGPTANNSLLSITDPGANGTPTATTLATAPSGGIFRGVTMTPTKPALPVFDVQPAGTTNSYGSTVSFGPVDALGANPNSWTWSKGSAPVTNGPTGSGATVSGATTTTLTISGIAGGDAGTYYAVASNNGGSVTSSPAILGLAGSSITTQLKSITNAAGTTATFTVVSGGPPPLTYSWTFNTIPLSDGPSPSGSGATISGSATNKLTITGVQDADAGQYSVTVSDSTPADSSSTATLTVVDPPQITVEPADQNKVAGTTANFTVTATGGVLSYQWYRGSVVVTNGPTGNGSTNSGATSSHLSLGNVQVADAGASIYTVVVTNLAGSATSSPAASLTVGQIPAISFSNQTNWPGSNVTFSATVSGSAPLFYVWKHDGNALNNDGHFNNVDTPALSITPISTDDARRYTLTVSNSYGSTSVDGYLFVRIADPETSNIPGLILYEKFNYPVQPYPGFPAPAGWINNWEYIISTYNQVSGRAAYWVREGNAYSTIETGFLRDPSQSTSGQYPWPGVDCSSQNQWYWSSAPNNNHLKFGGVNQTNGAAYFSCILHVTQGSALNSGQADVIAGFTSGDSVNGGANVDTWNYTLATIVDNGGDGYCLGVFKGVVPPIATTAANGQWAASKHLARGGIHFVVGCYKFNSGGTTTNDDLVSLWIDPPTSSFGTAETNLPSPDAGGMITNWGVNAAVTEFGLRGNFAPASKRMTDLRIGTTWASVTGPYYPKLKIASTPPDMTLTWPAKDSGYVVQESPTLIPSAWVTNSFPPPYALDGTGTNSTVTVPAGAADYFRLVYPAR